MKETLSPPLLVHKGGREKGREGGRERGREGEREGKEEKMLSLLCKTCGEGEKNKPKKEECTASPQRLGEIAERLLQPYFDECKAALADGIVDDADVLDAGMIFGTGFAPFRGGPLHYLQTVASHEAAVSAPPPGETKADARAEPEKPATADEPAKSAKNAQAAKTAKSGKTAKAEKSAKSKKTAKADKADQAKGSDADAEAGKDGENAS